MMGRFSCNLVSHLVQLMWCVWPSGIMVQALNS